MSVHRQPAGTGRRGAMAASREAVAIEVGPSNPEDRFPPSQEAAENEPTRRRAAKKIPPPPDPHADWLSIEEAAGHARVSRRTIDQSRRRNPTFAALWRLVGGLPRIRRRAFDAWIESQPTGWSPMGGQRRGAFGHAEQSETGSTSETESRQT